MNRPVKFYQKKKGKYEYFDFTGFYEVDEDGNIYSLDRYVKHPKGTMSFKKGRLCKQHIKTDGYPSVCLSKEGIINEKFCVHKIVSQAFPEICGEWFEGCNVDHINTNKLDCRAENLRICTELENHRNQLTREHISNGGKGRTPWNKGKSGEYKIDSVKPEWWGYWKKRKVISIDKEGNETTYDSIKEAAIATGTHNGNIVRCCKGEYNTAGGYKWKYD